MNEPVFNREELIEIGERAMTEGVNAALTPQQEARIQAILHPSTAPWEMTPEQIEELKEQLQRGVPMAFPYGSEVIITPAIQVVALETTCRLPSKAKEGDAGWDLYVSRKAQVLVDGMTDLHTDIAIALPPGYFGRITGRSSTLRKRGLLVNEGIVDEGYRGELFIAVFNLGSRPVTIEPGERLAQLLIHRVEEVAWNPVKQLPDSQRGADGFGSSGK